MEKNAGSGRTPTLLERVEIAEQKLESIEKVLPQMHGDLNERFEDGSNRMRGDLQGIVKVLNAVIKLQGAGFDARIEEQIRADDRKRDEERLTKAKAVFQKLVDDKALIPGETVTEQCLLVGKEVDATGNVIGLGYAQAEFAQFTPEAKAGLLGKGVGAKYDGPNGGFIVDAIYVQNPDFKPPTPETVETPAPVAGV